MQTLTHFHALETLTLTFVSSEETYSAYQTARGELVYLQHGTAARLSEFGELDLGSLWREFMAREGTSWFSRDYDGFRESVRETIIDPDRADDITWCQDCSDPGDRCGDMYGTGHGDTVCEDCYGNYFYCEDCEESWHTDDMNSTLEPDAIVCDSCLSRNWSWCETCNGYRRDTDFEHDHDDDDDDDDLCQCEAPGQTFTIRNDGESRLANDDRATITLAAGTIDGEGIDGIRAFIRSSAWSYDNDVPETASTLRALARRLDELGDKWQTREGNYTKRLSRFAYKEFGHKLSPEIVSRVGCIARDHSTAVNFAIEVTRDLNMSAADFYHEDSCWFTDYAYRSRCALKSNGGFGIRTFDDDDDVSGRAWAMPMRLTPDGELTPTFDTTDNDAFVVFNGYGSLEGYVPARILAHMAGMTYRKISFTCSPMYVNNSAGYLIAPEEIASTYTDGSLSLYVSEHSHLYANETRDQ